MYPNPKPPYGPAKNQGKHWLYHWFEAVHLPEAQVVGPVQPEPPHWPYKAAPEPLGGGVVGGVDGGVLGGVEGGVLGGDEGGLPEQVMGLGPGMV